MLSCSSDSPYALLLLLPSASDAAGVLEKLLRDSCEVLAGSWPAQVLTQGCTESQHAATATAGRPVLHRAGSLLNMQV
jgi:hypothetical protein